MSISALVIGYGSIGRRHADILSRMDQIGHVTILSNQSDLPYKTIRRLDEIVPLDPDYVVVASNTAIHYTHLTYLEETLYNKVILVEKPLFEKSHSFTPVKNSVWVAYVFRFHPIFQMIRKKIFNKQLWNIHVFCGSYLPDWRPNRDYRETSSASKESGGGVLLDLSHELDYVQWLAGRIEIEHVYKNKVSSLMIETEDLLVLNGYTDTGARIQMSLNYFTRQPKREIIIDGENISIQADLISNRAVVHLDGEFEEYCWPDLEMNDVYRREHEAVLAGDTTAACSYQEGLETMELIDRIAGFGIN